MSIVVPSAAKKVAAKVAEAAAKVGRKDLLFLDANAISPMTADDDRGGLDVPPALTLSTAASSARRRGWARERLSMFRGREAARCRRWRLSTFRSRFLARKHQSSLGLQSRLRGTDQRSAGTVLRIVHGRAAVRPARTKFVAQYEESFPGLIDKVSVEHRRLAHSRRAARRGDGRA